MNPNNQQTQPVSIESVANPGETYVFYTRKHPLGIIYVYIQTIIGFGIAGGLIYVLLPDFVATESQANVRSIIALMLVLLAGVMALILLLATWLYSRNKIIVSNKNVTQVMQRGLFSRKISELSLGSVEDVTADKHGLMATLFNYGDLRIETAGEQNNFVFTYCPNPDAHGQQLLAARQTYHETHGDQAVS